MRLLCFFWILVSLVVVGCSRNEAPAAPAVPLRSFLRTASELEASLGPPTKVDAKSSTATYKSGDFTVWASFAGDECQSLRYMLPRCWTDEQISAALAPNGHEWHVASTGMDFMAMPAALRVCDYVSAEGHHARYTGSGRCVEVWSVRLLADIQAAAARTKAHDAEVPRL